MTRHHQFHMLDGSFIQHLYVTILGKSGDPQSDMDVIPVPMALFRYSATRLAQHREEIRTLLRLMHRDFYTSGGAHLDVGLLDQGGQPTYGLGRDDVFKLLVMGIACGYVSVTYIPIPGRHLSHGIPMYRIELPGEE